MPPHNGHVLLCEFAQRQVRQLTILVCSLPDDGIPGLLRAQWMRELFPQARVLWCNEVLPQQPEDDPANFWPIWRDVVRRHHPEPVDVVFASEAYGARLADEVGARFIPCDPVRAAMPVSGTAIRANPLAHWRHLPDVVRAHFVKRVCVFGPESSGKTTLAELLANHLDDALAPEYGRTYTDVFGVQLDESDLIRIAEGQMALSAAARRLARRVVIEDTDAVLTGVWSQMLLDARSPWFDHAFEPADLYLLCDIDFPWVDDGTRYFADPARRRHFFALCERALIDLGAPYVLLRGDAEHRLARAVAAIEERFGLIN
jgi:NadR type nicotinamide-nucleotide adenylyltransferase